MWLELITYNYIYNIYWYNVKCILGGVCAYWISRGLGFFGFLGYIGFQSQNASFRATCAQKGREEKCWMLWFLSNQWWSTGETGRSRETENSRKQSETVGNSRKQSGAARRDRAKIVNPPFFLQKKNVSHNPLFFFWKCNGKQLETVGARTFDSAKKELFKTSL